MNNFYARMGLWAVSMLLLIAASMFCPLVACAIPGVGFLGVIAAADAD